MADTTPLPKTRTGINNDLKDVVTKDVTEHYNIHAQGLYGNRQYADLSLILRKRSGLT